MNVTTTRLDERAVSPVIGVILMVAITVILAAVIGAFVLNLGASVDANVQAGATVSTTAGNEVKVTWTSNQNANDLEVSLSGCVNTQFVLSDVGSTTTSTPCNSGDTATVIVVAKGDGDRQTVVIDREINF